MKNARDCTRNSFRRCYRRTALLFQQEEFDWKYLQANRRRQRDRDVFTTMFLRCNRSIERSRFRCSIERAKEGALTR